MKKVMLFVVSMLLAISVNVNAASLSLTTAGAVNADQSVSSLLNNGPLAIGRGETAGGNWQSFFNLTTDKDTSAIVEWSFNPEHNVVNAILQVWQQNVGLVNSFNVMGDFIAKFYFLAGEVYSIDFLSVNSEGLSYDVSVNAVPVPAALFLLAPALLGFLGLRRKTVSTSVVAA